MTLTRDVEMLFSSSDGYVSVMADVRRDSAPVAFWGLRSGSPTDKVAETGTFTFTLDNSEAGSGGVGYYSPDNATLRAGFAIGTPVRVKMTDGVTTLYKLYYISSINPEPGSYRGRGTNITATDFMARLGVQYADTLTVLTNKKTDEALTTLIASCSIAPLATDYSAGPYNLAYVFHDIDGRKTTVLNALQRLLQSDMNYCVCDADSTGGETLVYQTRQDTQGETSFATFTDTMTGLSLLHADDRIYNDVAVISYPVNLGAAVEVVYSYPREQQIIAGESVTFTARYRDPSASGESIRMLAGSEVTPVADTDYKMSSIAGNGGNNLNANLTVAVTWYADSAIVTLTNSGAVTGHVNLFQLRATLVRLYDPAESNTAGTSDNIALYGSRPLRFVMPYQDNVNVAASFATALLSKWGTPQTAVEALDFVTKDTATESLLLAGGIGKRITVKETVTGVDADYSINGIEWTLEPTVTRVRWYCERLDTGVYWELDVSTLDDDTVLDV